MGIGRTVLRGDCMLVDIDDVTSNNFVTFQYYPKISYERDARIKPHQVPGRNMESYHFVGGAKTMTLTFDFVPEVETREDMMRRVDWLEALTYNENYKEPPHRVIVVFGDVFKGEKWIVAKVKPSFDLHDKRHELRPNQAYVEVSLMRWAEYNIKRSDILRGTSFQGTASLFTPLTPLNTVSFDPPVANAVQDIPENQAFNEAHRKKVASMRANILAYGNITGNLDGNILVTLNAVINL